MRQGEGASLLRLPSRGGLASNGGKGSVRETAQAEKVVRGVWKSSSDEPEALALRCLPRRGESVTEKLLTAAELAEILGLSAASVLDRWERGDLPGFRLFGRKGGPVRFRESEVLAILETWRHGPVVTSARVS